MKEKERPGTGRSQRDGSEAPGRTGRPPGLTLRTPSSGVRPLPPMPGSLVPRRRPLPLRRPAATVKAAAPGPRRARSSPPGRTQQPPRRNAAAASPRGRFNAAHPGPVLPSARPRPRPRRRRRPRSPELHLQRHGRRHLGGGGREGGAGTRGRAGSAAQTSGPTALRRQRRGRMGRLRALPAAPVPPIHPPCPGEAPAVLGRSAW